VAKNNFLKTEITRFKKQKNGEKEIVGEWLRN